MDIAAADLTDENDRLLLEAQRAAAREDWGPVMAAADEVLKNDPLRVEALFLSALALRRAGNEGTAAQLLSLATKLEPNRAPIWLNLAMCLHERHPVEAYRAALKAQHLKPDLMDTLSVLCNVSSTLGRHAEALEWAERCERKYGFQGEVAHNKSFALFALGRWKEAWREFKPSLGQPDRKIRNYHSDRDTPRWNPKKHENAVVVIYGEQGIGDEVMYASMIPAAIEAAKAKGSRVVIECYDRNAELFRRSFPEAEVYGTLREMYCDWPRDEGVTHKLEMGGLGEYFAPEPIRGPAFLAADSARGAAWAAWFDRSSRSGSSGRADDLQHGRRARGFGGRDLQHQSDGHAVLPLHEGGGSHPDNRLGERRASKPRVGIAWTGGSWETGRGRRSIPFEDILSLMRGQNVTFVSLEYEDRRKDLEFAPDVLNPHWATRKGADMDDLAAILTNLDLVISVQTSVVDYCGALGVPCWALTDAVPQWRYTGFFGEDTMGFYESVKVYRQKQWGEWKPVIQQVARDLKALTDSKAAAA